ncbi:MAG: tetratricopeptide repeat protein [Pyrinomonadaceae bacterium]
MSSENQKKLRAVMRVPSLVLILITATALSTSTLAQPSQSRKNLSPVHWPEVTGLEPEVRDQLARVEKNLKAAINNPSATDATLAEGFGESGRTYHAYSLFLPARDCYQNAAVLAPKNFRWPYLLAKIDQLEGHTDDAIKRFHQAGALNADYVAVDVNLGNIYLELNLTEKAEASFKKALTREQNNAAALHGLGQLALSLRRYAEAVSYFERALQAVPAANRIHYSLALAYRGLGDLARAETHLAQRGTVGIRVADPLFDQLPELIEGERVHLARGRTALDAKRFEDAAVEFRKAVALKPNSVAAHLNLGTTLVQTNDLDGAVAEFKTVLRIDSENANARFNLAFVLENQNKHAEAIDELNALLKLTPSDSSGRLFLAQVLLKMERREESLKEFLTISETEPDNEEALLQAVTLLVQSKEYARAVGLLEKSHGQYPTKGETAATLAYLLAASPQYDLRSGARALDLAQKVYQASGLPQHGAIGTLALAELGRCKDAAAWQQKMITLAEEKQQTALAAKLKADLKLYENKESCRPAGQ